MSFDRLSSLEAQSGGRAGYSDDPGFQQLLHELRTKLRDLEKNILKLRTDVNLLGTRRDTARVRERVHDLLEKSREECRGIGEGVKKLQTWEDLSVCESHPPTPDTEQALISIVETTQVRAEQGRDRVPRRLQGLPGPPADSPRQAARLRLRRARGARFRGGRGPLGGGAPRAAAAAGAVVAGGAG